VKDQIIKRLRNKAFVVSIIAAILLLVRQTRFRDLLPGNIDEIINSILAILSLAGVISDPTTDNKWFLDDSEVK
jgi:phi LC3 family holin